MKKSTEQRQAEAAARTEQYVQRLAAEAPPLTDEQRSRLAVLLQPIASEANAGPPSAVKRLHLDPGSALSEMLP